MESIRKWFYRPKKDDKSLLAQFFYADEALNLIASELDSFDGRKDPERCTSLVNQLRQSQDRVLTITNAIMDVLIADERANRDFRVKFPEDVLQENLAGQLWFGAECLAAGSSIMNRETESAEMRPLAKALTKSLDNVRNLLREACLRNNTPNGPLKLNNNEVITEILLESLKIFDRLFAEFELCYVSAMVPVKSTQEYELQELIGVLFSETLQRALQMRLLAQDMVDDYDPALMFTIPRLAIVSGLLVFPNGPLSIDKPMEEMSEMFRPFRTLLHKIRELLWTLNKRELYMLEKLLCDNEQISGGDFKIVNIDGNHGDLDAFVDRFYTDYPNCKDFVSSFYTVSVNCGDLDVDLVDEAKEKEISVPNINCFAAVVVDNGHDDYRVSPNYVEDEDVEEDEASWQACDNEPSNTERKPSKNIEIPSTSGYLIANAVTHDTLVTSITDPSETKVESLPDHDCLEVISVAAATLSSILLTKNDLPDGSTIKLNPPGSGEDDRVATQKTLEKRKLINKHHEKTIDSLDSPDDSGICTENTSLDRSPSLDLQQQQQVPSCKCYQTDSTSTNIRNECTYSRGGENDSNAATTVASLPRPSGTSNSALVCNGGSHSINNRKYSKRDDDTASIESSDTSSFNSNCADDEEIALAMQAAEIASRNEVRAKFRSSEDLVHRLFVCIAGVADQLQTNFASDLRNILKSVFLINASDSTESLTESSMEYHPSENEVIENNEFTVDPNILAQEALFDSNVYFHLDQENGELCDYGTNVTDSEYSNHPRPLSDSVNGLVDDFARYATLRDEIVTLHQQTSEIPIDTDNTVSAPSTNVSNRRTADIDRPPVWIPDVEAPKCMSCSANFTVVKRRHHCRNCGKIFCARCSSNSVPLPKYGHYKAVRVCNKCFMYHLTPFTM